MIKSLGIIVPLFNEEKVVEIFFERLKVLEVNNFLPYIYFINDNSSDSTKKKLEKIKNKNKNVTLINNKVNLGQNKCVKKNINKIPNHTIYLLIDGDGQHTIEDINMLITNFHKKNYNLYFGIKTKEMSGDTFVKRITSMIASIILKIWYINKDIEVTNFFFFDKKVKGLIPKIVSNNSLSVELIHKYKKLKYSSFKYVLKERIDGESKYNFLKRIKLLIGLMFDRFN